MNAFYKRWLIFIHYVFVGVFCYANNREPMGKLELDRVSQLLDENNCNEAKVILDTLSYDPSIAPYFFYFRGVSAFLCGNNADAQFYFNKSIKEFDNYNYKDECYLDATLRLIDLYRWNDEYMEEIAKLSKNALIAPKNILDKYVHTYSIYVHYANALNSLFKSADIENVVIDGLPYVEKSLSPTDKEYYNLRFTEIIGLTLMNRWDRASRRLEELDSINIALGNNIIDEEVKNLRERVNSHKDQFDWRGNAQNDIDWFYDSAKMLILSNASTEEGAQLWKQFFNVLRDKLELFYFDLNNNEDERYWNQLLTGFIVYFVTCCPDMPTRTEIAYDLILLRKNFLDYHIDLIHKTPKRWQDVRNYLDEGELAIEITMYPEEVLILGKDFTTPLSVTIPEELTEKIISYNAKDASTINDYYSTGSPISKIVELVKPYLDGIKTIYISPTNHFAQFNYGAIPLGNGRLSDLVNVVQMTTTADINHYKKTKGLTPSPKSSVIIGGIDYDIDVESNISFARSKDSLMLSELRSGVGYLPFSLKEVNDISTVIGSENCVLLTGEEASEFALTNMDLSNIPIFHLATHGYSLPHIVANDSISRFRSIFSQSGLLLAGANISLKEGRTGGCDGILTSGEIIKLNLSNVQLAVLSFCSSGLGDITNTTGVIYGVANAMKTSGVNEILISLWDIPDEATSIAMPLFYKYLMEGVTSQEALNLVRQDMIDKGYKDPYYWASFVILD